MKAINITERIRRIKDLIGRASLKTAFDDLEDLIRSIDGKEIENEEEREFINQLITIKARYNSFNDSVITGIGAQQTELNQITSSLLSLTDSVQELLANNPDLIIPVKQEEITASLAIPVETVETTHSLPNTPSASGADNSGCLLSFSKSADQTNLNVQANWLKILGGLGLFILALALGLKLIFGMDGCGKTTPPIIPPVVTPPVTRPDPGETNLPEDKVEIDLPINSSRDIEEMAEMLNTDQPTGREQVVFSNILFGKNSVRLNTKAKLELDHMAMVLKQMPGQRIVLSATVGPNETTSYKGSKEITLGDVRAQKMFEYLKAKGVPITQMEFEGGGVSEVQRATISLY